MEQVKFLFCDSGIVGHNHEGGEGKICSAFSLFDNKANLLLSGSSLEDNKPNNYGELKAIKMGLQLCKDQGIKNFKILTDSEFSVKAIKGEFEVSAPSVKPILSEVKKLIEETKPIEINWIPRELNVYADYLTAEPLQEFRKTKKKIGTQEQALNKQKEIILQQVNLTNKTEPSELQKKCIAESIERNYPNNLKAQNSFRIAEGLEPLDAPAEFIKFLKNPKLLNFIDKEFDKKIVEEHDARKTIFLVANMRNVENRGKATDNLMINAPSGTGKDHISEAIFDLLPDNEKEELIRTTPKVLSYTRNKILDPNASWKKVALRLEDVGNEVLNDDAFKVMSSANPNKINSAKTINKAKVIEILIEGKPSIIMTIAEANPKEEVLRRYPICPLDDSINQTKEILKRQAEFSKTGKSLDYDERVKKALSFLKIVKVKVPFADKLIPIFCPENVIVRTHFPRFIDYIKSCCALHQYQRTKDEQGYLLAEEQDYNLARMMLQKTTSNILMIPLDKTKKQILSCFEKYNLQRKSVDDLEDYDEIKKMNITPEWLRRQLDWLVSKTFLIKDKERREDENGKIISKPVFIYTFNKMQQLLIPEWKDLDKVTSNTNNSENSSDTSISSDSIGVNEVNELSEVKKSILTFELDNEKPVVEVVKC